jgi:hypothetical protein
MFLLPEAMSFGRLELGVVAKRDKKKKAMQEFLQVNM